MSSKTAVSNLHNLFANVFQKTASTSLDVQSRPTTLPSGSLNEKATDKSRFNLLEFLFPDRGLEAYREAEGERNSSVVVYHKMGDIIVASHWSPSDQRGL